jgi:hypothetical protein
MGMDCFTKRDGMNDGHKHHISDAGKYTIPWNNYEQKCTPKKKSKYTEPPHSIWSHYFSINPRTFYDQIK